MNFGNIVIMMSKLAQSQETLRSRGQLNFNNPYRSLVAQTGAHETGHELGLRHEDKDTVDNPTSVMKEDVDKKNTTITQQKSSIGLNNNNQQQDETIH